MAEDDMKTMIREFRASVSGELEHVHRRVDEMESGLLNELKSLGRHLERIDRRLANLEDR